MEERNLLCLSHNAWKTADDIVLENVPRFGINTLADETRRLAVVSGAILLSHDSADRCSSQVHP